MEAWTSNAVPCEISSSRFIAVQYKAIINAWESRLNRTREGGSLQQRSHLYVVEIGSGHCTLAYRLARAFWETDLIGKESGITVVMTGTSLKQVANVRRP